MHRSDRRDGGKAPLGLAAVLLQMSLDQGLDSRTIVHIKSAALEQMVGEQPVLGPGPRLEGRDELTLINEPVLQSKQSKEQVAIDGACCHGTGLLNRRRGWLALARRRRRHLPVREAG